MAFRCRVISGGYCEMNQGYKKGTHYGVDIVGKNYTLANILAHSDGVVVKVRGNCNKTYSSNEAAIKDWGDGFGNFVMIKHIDGYYTQYEHLAYNSVKVKVGDKVRIISGPFAEFIGDITEVYPDKSKLRAMVSIFGRETPVELEYKQIQKV